jgi:hypothetical protein
MPDTRASLNIGRTITLDATGAGTITLGPESAPGTAAWHITGVIVQTNRPNVAPIPAVQFYRDTATPENSLGLSPNGSFGQAVADEYFPNGSKIICVWSGGQAGDRASLTLNGEKLS